MRPWSCSPIACAGRATTCVYPRRSVNRVAPKSFMATRPPRSRVRVFPRVPLEARARWPQNLARAGRRPRSAPEDGPAVHSAVRHPLLRMHCHGTRSKRAVKALEGARKRKGTLCRLLRYITACSALMQRTRFFQGFLPSYIVMEFISNSYLDLIL